MRKLLFILALIPLIAFAQEEEKEEVIKKDNSKYLGHIVPVVDGKVVFSHDISVPGKSKEEIFDIMLAWAQGKFKPSKERSAKVLYSEKEKGVIVCHGDAKLVFVDKALSLDQTIINYRFTINCTDSECNLIINHITYRYENQNRILAEEWITDENAVNKKRTKLYRMTGKFRIKTVDFVENLFESAQASLIK